MENKVEIRKINFGGETFAVYVNGVQYQTSVYIELYDVEWIPKCFEDPDDAARFGKLLKSEHQYKARIEYENDEYEKNIVRYKNYMEKQNKIKNINSFYV